MGRKRGRFGDIVTDRATFERGEARCPNCKRPVGPADNPTAVQSFGGVQSRLATMRCGRCDSMLTLRFEDAEARTEQTGS